MDVTTRNASLEDLASILTDQQARKIDMVVPAASMRARNGLITVKGAEQQIDLDGVTTVDGVYRPTEVFDEGVADKLKIPITYLRRLRSEAVDLYDLNINRWLHGHRVRKPVPAHQPDREPVLEVVRQPDHRNFLLRAFRGDEGQEGVARALLSDRYDIVDNLDVLTSMLQGVRDSGTEVKVTRCDLTDRRMYVRVAAPGVMAHAPRLLNGYRSPFADPAVDAARWHGNHRDGVTAESDGGAPVVFAGFDIRNSETGDGAFSIVPVITVLACTNGMTVTKEAYRKVHTGSRMEQGTIKWSDDTQEKNLELIRLRTRDAVKTFLDVRWVEARLVDIEEKAGAPVADPQAEIKRVGKALQFSEGEIKGVLDHFIRGGQMTAGGVANAVTSFSQTVVNADRAYDLDDAALRALELAATH